MCLCMGMCMCMHVCVRLLERGHGLNHGARLGAAVRCAATEDLVGTEQRVGLRLVGVDHPQYEVHRGEALRAVAVQPIGHGGPRERTLCVVDAVVLSEARLTSVSSRRVSGVC